MSNFQKNNFFVWIGVFNNVLFSDLWVPSLFYRSDVNLIKLAKQYDFVKEYKWKITDLDYSDFKEKALFELACKMASNWEQYYDVMFEADSCRFEAVRSRLRSFGVASYGIIPHFQEISPRFRKLVRGDPPGTYKQF